jgi:putative NADH-flavin reductase
MRILVLGATGGIGLEIVRNAIGRGHSVTALVRSPERLHQFGNDVNVLSGDLLDSSELHGAIKGKDAVLSGFGPRTPVAEGDKDLMQRFAEVLTDAMRDAAVSRLIVVSTSFLFKDSIIPPTQLVGRLFFAGVVADATVAEATYRQSGLGWTIVRPPRLTDKAYTGRYRVREGHLPRFGFTVSRADVADFMVQKAIDDNSAGKIFGVSH